jgi:pimeloyl-ACP methyl ester carboxylesterase
VDHFSIGTSEVHYERYGAGLGGPPLVFLHEGLGSIELWRNFPSDVVTASRCPGLAYSRHGNGWSSPLTGPRQPDYMHEEALDTLPRLIDELVGRPPILVGHSDGASVAIIYAGAGHPVEGLVLIAPHVFVESETVRSIQAIRDRFPGSDMAEKMAKYHAEPESTFYGWADIWLSPEFESWNIEEYLPAVTCPTILVQGDADEYGTVRQLDAIAAGVDAPVDRLIVPSAGHSPHLSHPRLVADSVAGFVGDLTR